MSVARSRSAAAARLAVVTDNSIMNNKTSTPFLDQLDAATKLDDVGIFLIDQFLPRDEADNAFDILNSNAFPWELKPTLYRQQLNQHAHEYRRSNSNIKRSGQSTGMSKLEELCTKIEKQFDGKVSYVYCNRFQDPEHNNHIIQIHLVSIS